MRDMISTTPLAEYIDMLYTRLAIEMPRHEAVQDWWVELHPPSGEREGVGTVHLRANALGQRTKYVATMHAVEVGAIVDTSVLEQVVEHHIAKFVEPIEREG